MGCCCSFTYDPNGPLRPDTSVSIHDLQNRNYLIVGYLKPSHAYHRGRSRHMYIRYDQMIKFGEVNNDTITAVQTEGIYDANTNPTQLVGYPSATNIALRRLSDGVYKQEIDNCCTKCCDIDLIFTGHGPNYEWLTFAVPGVDQPVTILIDPMHVQQIGAFYPQIAQSVAAHGFAGYQFYGLSVSTFGQFVGTQILLNQNMAMFGMQGAGGNQMFPGGMQIPMMPMQMNLAQVHPMNMQMNFGGMPVNQNAQAYPGGANQNGAQQQNHSMAQPYSVNTQQQGNANVKL